MNIEVFEHASGDTEIVMVDKDEFSDYGLYTRNVAKLYEAFADGKGEKDGVLDWDFALQTHQFIEDVYVKAGVH